MLFLRSILKKQFSFHKPIIIPNQYIIFTGKKAPHLGKNKKKKKKSNRKTDNKKKKKQFCFCLQKLRKQNGKSSSRRKEK